ncbi:putative DUF3068 domain-containing protein [Azospirillaceae bacterium]
MTYVEHRYPDPPRGYFERMSNSFFGIPIGVILIVLPIALLWWNEDRAVAIEKAIGEAQNIVVSIDSKSVEPRHNGKLVHVTGVATAAGAIKDSALDLSFPGYLVINRQVEMFQWKEIREDKAWVYRQTWSRDWENSDHFKYPQGHVNPRASAQSDSLTAKDARLGTFRLDDASLGRVEANIAVQWNNRATGMREILPPNTPAGHSLLPGGVLYRGKSPEKPQVGDLRITYTGLPSGSVLSIIARQSSDSFAPYPTSNGQKIQIVRYGDHTPQEMFNDELSNNSFMTWMLRLGGLFGLWIGFMLLLGPLSSVLSFLPFVGELVEGAIAIFALVFALVIGSVVIALAWLAVHPFFSLVLAGTALLTGFGILYLRFAPP